MTSTGPALQTFATVLPIKQGQIIGLDVPANAKVGLTPESGTASLKVSPFLANGATVTAVEFPGEQVGFSAQVQVAPTLTGLAPSSGGPEGGTQVTIVGTELEGASAVQFGTAPATAFAVASESQITAYAPAGTGAVPVSVTTPAGTAVSPQAFIYTAPAAPTVAAPGTPPTATPAAPPAGIAPAPSIPKPTCTVPKLKGKTLKSAKKRITGAACRLGTLTKKEGATAKYGQVVNQTPKPGATVPVGTKVKVTLAP